MVINRLHPQPFERLSSYLARLGQANYYETPYWFRNLIVYKIAEPIDYLSSLPLYTQLARITNLSVDDVYQMTVHRYSHHYGTHACTQKHGLQGSFWNYQGLSTYVHGTRFGKICPYCFQENPIYQTPWMLRHVTTCTRHMVLLVDRCSVCHSVLTIDRKHQRCSVCRTPLTNLRAISINHDSLSMTFSSIVAKIFGLVLDSAISLSHIQQSPLNHLSNEQLLYFLWYGFQLLRRYDVHASRHDPTNSIRSMPKDIRTASVIETHNALVAMFQLLYDWPTSWNEVLEHLVACKPSATLPPFPMMLERYFPLTSWQWLHESWLIFTVQHAYDRPYLNQWLPYYRKMQHHDFMKDYPSLLTTTETMALLRLSEEQLNHAIQTRQLRGTPVLPNTPYRMGQFFDALSVRQLRQNQHRWLNLSEVAHQIGLSTFLTRLLVQSGWLSAERISSGKQHGSWSFDPSLISHKIATFFRSIPVCSYHESIPSDIYSLQTSLRIKTKSQKSLLMIISSIERGHLNVYRDSDVLRFDHLWFYKHDVLTFLSQQDTIPLLSMHEVCQQLGCTPETLQKLRDAKLLVPISSTASKRPLYAPETLKVFLQNYIDVHGASKILGVTQQTVQIWTREGLVPAVTGPTIDGSHSYRFEKSVVLRWRFERLTVGETLKILNISKATLHRWVKQQKLLPIPQTGGVHRWFWRNEVLQLCKVRQQLIIC